MKKRLLSALLAMVMVLAMLPMSAFATPAKVAKGTTVYYYGANAKFQSPATEGATATDGPGWYSRTESKNEKNQTVYTYRKETSGVLNTLTPVPSNVTGGTSAKLFSDLDAAIDNSGSDSKQTSISLLTGQTLNANKVTVSSLNINVNGQTLTLNDETTNLADTPAGTNPSKGFTQLKVTNSAYKDGNKGALTGSISVKGKGFTLDVTDVGSNAINTDMLTLDNTTNDTDKKASSTLIVKANNAYVGNVEAKNAKVNVTVSNKGNVGSITSGSTSDCSAKTGATINVSGQSIVGNVNIYGTGSLTVGGYSNVGEVTLFGGTKALNGGTSIPNWKTTATISNSTVVKFTQDTGDEVGHTITLDGGSKVTGDVTLSAGGSSTLNVQGGSSVGGKIEMAHGTLKIDNGKTDVIEIAASGDEATNNNKGAMNITVSNANSSVGNITLSGSSAPTITPAITVNAGTVGTIPTTGVSLTVNGGTIGRAAASSELNANLRGGWQVALTDKNQYLYTTNFQDLIDAYQAATNKEAVCIQYVGDTVVGTTAQVKVEFEWNENENNTTLTVITMTPNRTLTLPTTVQKQTVQYWFDGEGANKGIAAGTKYPITKAVTLTVRQTQVGKNLITGITANEKGGNAIGCTVNGTTINLSGALKNVANGGDIELKIEIDGDKDKLRTVNVAWSADGGIFVASVDSTNKDGVTVVDSDSYNQIKVYDTIYTITGNGLSNVKDRIEINSTLTQRVSVPNASAGLSGTYAELGKVIKEKLETSTADFSQANGILAQLNATINGLSQSTIDGYISSACNAQASYLNKKNNLSGASAYKGSDFTAGCKVILTPYLELSFSNWSPVAGKNPTATLNITPKYRYTVVNGSNTIYKDEQKVNGVDVQIPWEQTGNLTVSGGDYGKVTITLKMPANTVSAGAHYAHHNGYVYDATWTGSTELTTSFTVVNGFSPFNFNLEDGVAYISTEANGADVADPAYTFETLQEAVDATVNGNTVVMRENYNGPINMSGAARDITIRKPNGGGNSVYITDVTGANSTFNTEEVGSSYKLQLTANTQAPAGSVSILQGSFANGTMTLSASKANANSQVTVNLNPASGYVVNTVTAKTNTGANVTLTATGTANQYTFTVPAGATSVTVTPSFVASGIANVIVNSTAYGVATTSAVGGTAQTGSTVTIYMTPNASCRTIGVTVRTNTGSSVYVNQVNANQYTFVVPAGAASVTVTPTFDRETGMPFVDVLSTDSYLSYVQYVYNHGMVNGTTTTTFGGNEVITRAQIVTILYRLSGSPAVTGSSTFVDVPAGVYAAPVAWAQANNVVTGTTATTFEPDRAITRQELATILYRYHVNVRKLAATNSANLNAYTDRGLVAADWGMAPVQWCVGNGIINGTTPTTLEPNGTAIRYHAAAMLTRYCQNILGIQ